MLIHVLFLGLFACELWQQSSCSAQQDKLSHSVVCRPLLFRLSLKWQDCYHKGQLHPLGNICMSASLSASFSVSICHPFSVLFPCFLISFFFILLNTLSLSFILSLCFGWKRWISCEEQNRLTIWKQESLKGNQRDKMFSIYCIQTNLIFPAAVYICVLSVPEHSDIQFSTPAR